MDSSPGRPVLFPDLPDIDQVIERPTSSDYAVAARFALERKQLPRAVEQVSAALALAPLEAEYLQLLDRILAASRAPLMLAPLREHGTFFGLIAVRAQVLARLGRHTEALELITEVVVFRPDIPFLVWTGAWLKDARSTRRLSPSVVATLLLRLCDAAERVRDALGAKQNLDAAIELAEHVARTHSEHSGLAVARSRMLRALDQSQAASRILDEFPTQACSWEIAVERAAHAREGGRHAECIDWLRCAAEARPSDPSTQLDLGDAQLEAAKPREALAAYGRALELTSSPYARAAAAYASWLLDRDPAILTLGDQDPRASVSHFRRDALGYEDVLLDPFDPLVAVVRSALRRARTAALDQQVRVRVHVERPLAPSARLAFRHGLAELGRIGELDANWEGREPCLGRLWKSERGVDVALLPEPPDETRAALARAAAGEFSWSHFFERASALVRDSEVSVDALVRAAVHPPLPPPGTDAVEWIQRAQICAALAIVAHRAEWMERRRALGMLTAASDDWVSIAGVLGLGAALERAPELTASVQHDLAALLPKDGDELPIYARALGIVGMRAFGTERGAFLSLRARALFRVRESSAAIRGSTLGGRR